MPTFDRDRLSLTVTEARARQWETTFVALGSDPQSFGLAVIAMDVTEHARSLREMRLRASLDPLTNLPHRGEFFRRLTMELGRVDRSSKLVVSMGDLDQFKAVNDRYGHAVGDEVLRIIAARLRASQRTEDTVARLGGDEFVIVARHHDSALARASAARACAAVEEPIRVNELRLRLSMSIGIHQVSPTDGVADIMVKIDQAMYAVKGTRAASSWLTGEVSTRPEEPKAVEERQPRDIHPLTLLRSRAIIEQAKGIVMAMDRCSEPEASRVLIDNSEAHRLKVVDLAHSIVALTNQDGREHSEHLTGRRTEAIQQAIGSRWSNLVRAHPP